MYGHAVLAARRAVEAARLLGPHARVRRVGLAQQRGVRALLDEQAVLHDEDEVGVDDRLQLVRHHHGGHVPARGVDHLDHRALDERVERARRLVAQQQRRPLEERALFLLLLPLS